MGIPIGLSKSKYCKGIQCPKILWMDKNKPEEAEDILPYTILSNGNRVGELAREYFGEYALVEYDRNVLNMCEATKQYLSAGSANIAEASFTIDGLYCAVDILHKNGDGWDIVEVKSSTHVSPIYIDDMAFQYYVLTNCGINIKSIYNMHIDNTYIFHDKLDIDDLFTLEDYTEICKAKYYEVAKNINSIRQEAGQAVEPTIDIGPHCNSPYECAYKGYCWKHIPYPSIFDISRLTTDRKFDYYNQGIITYEDVKKYGVCLNPKQNRQVEATLYQKPDEINRKAVESFLSTLSYPIYHLDFETFQTPIPEWEGCKPYEQIPFQYSLHIEYEDGRLEHKEFLAEAGKDPRRMLAERLCHDIPKDVCSLAYNMSFEKRIIRGLAALYSDLTDHLLNIHDNMKDLMLPFSKQSYYSAAMQGSYSIKCVLPALYPDNPELAYSNLEQVHHGQEASSAYLDLCNQSTEEAAETRKNLLKYCGLDTYAMVKVLVKLRESVQ